jgi:hypothetical protein
MWTGFYDRLGVHVYASDREVIRRTRTKLVPWSREGMPARKRIYRRTLEEHRAARELYERVCRGAL